MTVDRKRWAIMRPEEGADDLGVTADDRAKPRQGDRAVPPTAEWGLGDEL